MHPKISIVIADTLSRIGLAEIIRKMMPGVEIVSFSSFDELDESEERDAFFHYFVSAKIVLSGAAFFLRNQHKTIVLVHGDEGKLLPSGFHLLNVLQSEADLVRSIWTMAERSHGRHGAPPAAVREAKGSRWQIHPEPKTDLTPRECEVLKWIVNGLINKQIAEKMGVSLATVITHRNNLTDKIGTRSVAALTMYAISHGLVSSDEI